MRQADKKVNNYLQSRRERMAAAWQVERDAIEKFNNDDPWRWLEDIWLVDEHGTKYHQQGGVNPSPYGHSYFFYFLSSILQGMASDIYPYLEAHFCGDYCDRVYLTGLLDDMEDRGYFDENKLINWRSGNGLIETYDIVLGENLTHLNLTYGRYFRGSYNNKKRADIVRRWIAEKAAEHTGETEDVVQPENQKMLSNGNKLDATHSLQRADRSLDYLFDSAFRTAHSDPTNRDNRYEYCLDALALRLGFRPPYMKWRKVEFSKAKIRAMVDALNDHELLRSTLSVAFVEIGKRYGYEFEQLTEIKPTNDIYKETFDEAWKALNDRLENRKSRA